MNLSPAISTNYADLGHIKLHYASAGEGNELVILLHGFPEFWYSWRHQLSALGAEFTVVAPDLRGFNLSDKPKETSAYEVDNVLEDIAGLIKFFDKEKAVVVGHDWGAAIAWAMAAKKPEMVSKLVTMQVPPAWIWKRNQTAAQFFASWYMFFFQLPRIPEYILEADNYARMAKSLTDTTAERGIFSSDDIAEYKRAWSQPDAATSMLNYYRANIVKRLLGPSSNNDKIAAPTLFIYGEKDHAVLPQTVAGVADAVEGQFREHRIPNAGHWVQQEASDEVTQVLREFIVS